MGSPCLFTRQQALKMGCFYWLPGCGNIALFRTVPWLTWSPRCWPNYTQLGTIFQKKKSCSTIKLFSSSNMFFVRLFLANTWKKNRGSPCLFKRKGEFIPLLSLVWGKSLTFCTCTCSCARADDAKIVRSSDYLKVCSKLCKLLNTSSSSLNKENHTCDSGLVTQS